MKFKDKEYVFTTDKITDIWVALNYERALNNNKEISVWVKAEKKINKKFPARNRILCALEQIENVLEYLNTYELQPEHNHRNAFGFIEFLNCEYVVVHSIDSLAKTFDVSTKDIVGRRDCFSDFAYGDGNDKEVFEYIRSLCAVHPTDTSMHPTVHKAGEFDCCSRIVWDSISCMDQRDLTAVVYPSEEEGEAEYIGIQVEPFVLYLNKWIALMDDIAEHINLFVEKEKERLRDESILKVEDFADYTEYIDNLHKEYRRRVGEEQEYLFDEYKLAFQIQFENEETEKKKECYKAALKYMFDFLHKRMQEMDDKQYTGIKDLPETHTDHLFYELHQPIEGRSGFSNERSAFSYVYNLNSSHPYDVRHAREVLGVLKPLVNEYVEFHNTEPQEETDLLLQIATYFDALKQDGYINKSIPDTIEFRGNHCLIEKGWATMYIESENFVARDLKADDKEHIKMLEESRPWAKGMLKFQDTISDGEQFDYFGKLWSEYMKSEHFWCIYKKDGTFCGDVQLDKDSETEYHLYIQLMDDAPIEGFGTEMFEQLIEKIVEESGAKHLEFELWNEKDRSKIIFQEAGYDMTSGVWEYDC